MHYSFEFLTQEAQLLQAIASVSLYMQRSVGRHMSVFSVRVQFPTFFPSRSCPPCARTLSTLVGSENVTKPKPLRSDRTDGEYGDSPF